MPRLSLDWTEDPMLTASDLRAAHGDNTIFEGLSLTLSGDRRVGLVGPNGAGKTTLLRLLAGVDAPERGSVALGPGDRIGYLPQEPPGPELTIDRLLGAALGEVWTAARRARAARARGSTTPPRWRGTARRRSASARSAAGRCRLSSTARAPRSASRTCRSTRRSAAVSGGEAARALLAGVLLARPTILLLDEPTNHLDLDGLAWLEEFLDRLRRRRAGRLARPPLPRHDGLPDPRARAAASDPL